MKYYIVKMEKGVPSIYEDYVELKQWEVDNLANYNDEIDEETSDKIWEIID